MKLNLTLCLNVKIGLFMEVGLMRTNLFIKVSWAIPRHGELKNQLGNIIEELRESD